MRWSEELRSTVASVGSLPEVVLSPQQALIVSALNRSDDFAANVALAALSASTGRAPRQSNTRPLRMLLVKPVGDACNLACRYCYESTRRDSYRNRSMSPDELDTILENTLPHVSSPFVIGVHGGEPLLARLEFFERLMQKIAELKPGGVSVCVQTNGSLLDRRWASFFSEHKIAVGLSLDGPTPQDNSLRQLRNGKSSFGSVLRGIDFLRDESVEFGVISVLSKQQSITKGAAKLHFEGFQRLGIRDYDVHPSFSIGEGAREYNVTPSDYARFINTLFDVWLDAADPNIRIGTFEHFFQSMTGLPANACYRAGKCTSIIGVDPSGETSPCTRPFDDAYRFGNLGMESIVQIIDSERFQLFKRREADGQKATKHCRWAHVCGHGGCPHERSSETGQAINGRNVFCTCDSDATSGYPGVFTHIASCTEETIKGISASRSTATRTDRRSVPS